jgi:uncharacterized protein (DUF924 family)
MTQASDVLDFWLAAGEQRWFRKDPAFDGEFRTRFLAAHEEAAAGAHDGWADSAHGALALVLLLDQFPRNCFRGTPRMFATDAKARSVAAAAVQAGFDQLAGPRLRRFFYLPFMHSERIEDQERSVELNEAVGGESLKFALHHRDIIRRFGRFPHRNAVLGRSTTPGEHRFLDEGGFSG